MRNFTAEAEGAEFHFNTMHARELKLFQVYVVYNGVNHRFHMQINEAGDFKITDRDKCPAAYHKAEALLGNAIKIYGRPD